MIEFQIDCSEAPAKSHRGKSHAHRQCDLCEIESSFGMVTDVVNGVNQVVCPLCYASLHLDIAGDMGSGIIIWLPEISQSRLNLLVSTIFASCILGENGGISLEYLNKVKVFYKTLESRSFPVANFYGDSGHLFNSNHPLFMAQQLLMAKKKFSRQIESDENFLQGKIDGLRFLAQSKHFIPFYKSVSRTISGADFTKNLESQSLE